MTEDDDQTDREPEQRVCVCWRGGDAGASKTGGIEEAEAALESTSKTTRGRRELWGTESTHRRQGAIMAHGLPRLLQESWDRRFPRQEQTKTSKIDGWEIFGLVVVAMIVALQVAALILLAIG